MQVLNFIIVNFFNILTIFSCISSIYNSLKLRKYKKETLKKFGLKNEFEDFNKNKSNIVTQLNNDLLYLKEDSYNFNQELVRSMFTLMTELEANYCKIFSRELHNEITKLKSILRKNFYNNSIAKETITECVELLIKIMSLIKKVENNEWLK